MDAMEAIFTRRSVRKYTDEPVSEKEVETLLRAAMAAPSARNWRPWHFATIDERAKLEEIAEFHQYGKMAKDAPLAIAVLADESIEPTKEYNLQNCSAAIENMLLAAHALGLGAVWLGINPREQRMEGVRTMLGLPEDITPVAIVVVGRPAEKKERADRYDPKRVHRNKWEGRREG